MLLAVVSGVSAAAEPAECRNVRFGVVGCSDVAAVTAITSEVLKRLQYEPATINLPVPIIFASLQNRNIDVFLGNWMPAQEADSKPYLANRSVEVVGPNLEKAKFTLAVPQYLYDAGLKDFASIKRFAGPLDAAIYGIFPAPITSRVSSTT